LRDTLAQTQELYGEKVAGHVERVSGPKLVEMFVTFENGQNFAVLVGQVNPAEVVTDAQPIL
jgi:hypothetical protein